MDGIFLSYRHGRDSPVSRLLYDRMCAAFSGGLVFLDVTSVDPGAPVEKAIDDALGKCSVLLALIDEDWLGVKDDNGQRRLDQPDDYVRLEVSSALRLNKRVVPLLLGKASLPQEHELPRPLKALAGLNAVRLTHEGFESECDRLIRTLKGNASDTARTELRQSELPHPPNRYFIGRDNDLKRLHEALHTTTGTGPPTSRILAIAAMGGVGKTTLANEYARRYGQHYGQILWVDARRGYEAEFARLFYHLFPLRATTAYSPAEKAQQALGELAGSAVDRLLVIDNAEDADSVHPWLPRDATGCRSLITSRYTNWPEAEGVQVLHIDVLSPDAARDFLLSRTGRPSTCVERAAGEALAHALGYLPLALEQAAAFIKSGAGVNFADYLRLFRDAPAPLLEHGALGSTRYADPVAATWQTTITKLASESRAILRLCAWLSDTPIPSVLILRGADDVLALAATFGSVAPRLASAAAMELRLRDALAGLARYSMILDVTDKSFRLHGLVQTMERAQAAKDGHDGMARERALRRLTATFPDAPGDPAAWPLCRQLLPHQRALVCRLYGENERDSTAATVLLDLTASFLQVSGDAAAALPHFRQAMDSRERLLGPEHPQTLASINNLAECVESLGDHAVALTLHRRALEARERLLEPDHPDTLSSVNNLAGCLHALDDAAAALPLFRRALEARQRVLGPEHRETIDSMNNLAYCLKSLGEEQAALPLYRRALASRERVQGREHPDTLMGLNNLASCLRSLGKAEEALPHYQRSLEARERVIGPEHPQTLASLNNMASCLRSLGKAADALPLLRRAAAGGERVLGPDHPNTRIFRENLAACLRELRDEAR